MTSAPAWGCSYQGPPGFPCRCVGTWASPRGKQDGNTGTKEVLVGNAVFSVNMLLCRARETWTRARVSGLHPPTLDPRGLRREEATGRAEGCEDAGPDLTLVPCPGHEGGHSRQCETRTVPPPSPRLGSSEHHKGVVNLSRTGPSGRSCGQGRPAGVRPASCRVCRWRDREGSRGVGPPTLRKQADPSLPTGTNSMWLKLTVAECFRASPPTATH